MKHKFKPGQNVLFRPRYSGGAVERKMTIVKTSFCRHISLFSGEVVNSVAYLCKDPSTGRSLHLLEKELYAS